MSLKPWKGMCWWKSAKLAKGFGPKSNAFRPRMCRGCGRRLDACPQERQRSKYRLPRPRCFGRPCLWCTPRRQCDCGRTLPMPP